MENGDWLDIAQAPRDGSLIEIRNGYGILPSYGLHRWSEKVGDWVKEADKRIYTMDGPYLSWRRYDGDPSIYVDPTKSSADRDSLRFVDMSYQVYGKYQHCTMNADDGLFYATSDFVLGSAGRVLRPGALPDPRQFSEEDTARAQAMHDERARRDASLMGRLRRRAFGRGEAENPKERAAESRVSLWPVLVVLILASGLMAAWALHSQWVEQASDFASRHGPDGRR